MNKSIILTALAAFVSLTAYSQTDSLAVPSPSTGWFVGGGAGIQGMTDISHKGLIGGGLTTASFDLYGGKWLSPQLGVRIGLQAGPLGHKNTERFNIFYVHNDLMWNVLDRFGPYNSARRWSLVTYGHFGLLLEGRGGSVIEREFAAGVGLQASYRFYGPWSVVLDGRTMLLNSKASQGLARASANALTLGARYDFAPSSWHRAEGREVLQEGFWNDWFVSAGLGLTFLTEVDFNNPTLTGRFAPAAEVSAGKWISPAVAVRAGVQGLRYDSTRAKRFGFLYPHLDLLWNISNSIHPDELDRFWTFIPYVHYGFIWEYNPSDRKTLEREYAAGAGLVNRFNFAGPVDAFIDLRAQMLTAAASQSGVHSLGLAAIGGLSMDINPSGWRRAVPQLPSEKTRYQSDRFQDNWFVWGGAGVNTAVALHRKLRFNGRFTPAIDAGFGKWFSPIAGARLGVQGISLSSWGNRPADQVRTKEGTWRGKPAYAESVGMLYVHGDVLWSLVNTLYGYDFSRAFDLAPYMHFGVLSEWGKNGLYEREYAAGAGLLASLWITERLGALLDLRGSLLTANAALDKADTHPLALSAMLGVQYALGDFGWTEASKARYRRVLLNGIGDNWWISVLGGINTIGALKGFDGRISLALDLALGKWLSPEFGLRLGWQGLDYRTAAGEKMDFGYVHGDVLWNAVNTFAGYSRERRWDVVPYVHMGYIQEQEIGSKKVIERSYAAGPGLMGSWRITEGLNAVLDLRGTLLPSGLAGKSVSGRVLAASAMGGLSFDLGRRGWDFPGESYLESKPSRAHKELLLGKFFDQWFIGVSGGVNLGLDPGYKGVRFIGGPTLAGEYSLGKWVSPDFGFRGAYQGVSLAMNGEKAGYSYLHADLLWNLSRTFSGLKPHLWEAVPYMHFGGLYEWDVNSAARKSVEKEFASGVGLLNLFHIHENVAITADIRATALTRAASIDKGIGLGGAGSVLLGFQYGFDPASWRTQGKGVFADGFFDHWSLQLAGGAQYAGAFQLATDISLMKWFSPQFGARGGWQGLRIQGTKAPSYGFNYFHGDFLWDFTSTVLGYKPERKFHLVPYVHMGVVREYNLDRKGMHERDFAAGAGLMGAVRISDRMDLTGDLRATYLKSDIALGKRYLATALAGIAYHIGKSEFDTSASEEATSRGKRNMALTVNLMDLADLGTASLDIQYGIARHWTLDAGAKFNPWMPKSGLFDKTQTFSLGARWWPWYIYSGWWVKAKAQAQCFKRQGIPLRNDGLGEALGAGISGGYSLILKPWLNLDFGIGGWGGRQWMYDGSCKWFAEPEAMVGVMFVF